MLNSALERNGFLHIGFESDLRSDSDAGVFDGTRETNGRDETKQRSCILNCSNILVEWSKAKEVCLFVGGMQNVQNKSIRQVVVKVSFCCR